ncbi:hypothetical protein CTAYLR_003857 [Chrysophaeum taylorii]|uniref:Fe2OG dioxygenase domain-containing protein n=1 Tax=Chrysophaeum taylorii TaxID=2483200 RepID=A0AAD7XST8_9STRA|nr:hypothetical protein CTAYLR_003857 [Chrysophaeum taylorii]
MGSILKLLLMRRVVATTSEFEDRLDLWRRGVHEPPKCSDLTCSADLAARAQFARMLPVLRHRGGSTGVVEPRSLIGKLGEEYAAALALNEAEHARDCEKSCASFYCGEGLPDSTLLETREISMGSVPPEDFASMFHYPLDLIKVTREPVVSAGEASRAVALAKAENVDGNVFPSGKYKLGGDWLVHLHGTRQWFNHLLERTLVRNIAASFPEIVTNASTLRAHSVAMLKYNSSHPRTDVHVDNGIIALTFALSNRSNYKGGGTYFEHLGESNLVEMDAGHATWRPGSVRHGGHRVTRGERYIIGAFFLLSDRVEHVRRLKNRGSNFRAEGDVATAATHFKWALEINPKCTTCLKDLAEALVVNGTLDAAEGTLRMALDLLPSDSDALFSLGVLLSQKGDHRAALEAYRQSAAVNPDDAELLYNLGLKLQQVEGSQEEERRMYARALEADPSFAKAHCNLGAAYAEAGDDDKAEHHLVAASQDPSVAVTALQNLAMLYEKRAQRGLAGFGALKTREAAIDVSTAADVHLSNAQKTWDHLRTIAPPDVARMATSKLLSLLKTRGRLVAIADIPSAITILEQATALDPSDAATWQALARACSLVGDNVQLGMTRLKDLGGFAVKLVPWGLPAVLFAGWMVYPALTPGFKQSLGLESPPPSGKTFEFDKADVGEVPELKS